MDWYRVFAGILLIVSVNGQSPWRWECDEGFCQKQRTTDETRNVSLSLSACRLFCSNYANLWPRPNGKMNIGHYLAKLNVNSIDVLGPAGDTPINERIRKAAARFKDVIDTKEVGGNRTSGGKSLEVKLQIRNPEILRLRLDLDEGYTLKVSETPDGRIQAIITANNYFGARHGLETLSQLIIYDDIRDEFQIVRDALIEDKPVYTYRGILLDTSRNYISVKTIKRVLEGMALSKLNTFHWHITDSHSFPYVSKSRPALSKLGAYSPRKVYTPEMIADIIEYGLVRGIRVLPEFDAPAHVGEGWQDTGFVTCFNQKPWYDYCVEPPCGQFDPTQEGLYDYLEGIYQDMIEQFSPDIFHMGGDEVSLTCWNTSSTIVQWMNETKGWGTDEEDFMRLWDVFQTKALERYEKKSGKEVPIIMWTSTLTKPEYIKRYLPSEKYIIQIWTTGTDHHVQELLDRDYRVIFSNYDALYLDCGVGGWVNDGQNWCSPYIGWQKVYSNSPKVMAGDKVHLALGAEAALWSEQVDDSTVDARLWPRAAAMAERLWAEPQETWRKAEQRMLVHRERLTKRGILAESLEPEWCMQNENNCPMYD